MEPPAVAIAGPALASNGEYSTPSFEAAAASEASVMLYHTVPPRAVPLCRGRVTVLAAKSTEMALDRTTLARGSGAADAGASVAASDARMRAEVKRFICDIVRGGRALRCMLAYVGY